MNTPIERRQLVATEGMMAFDRSLSQYARVDIDQRWNFLGDFTLSVLACVSTGTDTFNILQVGSPSKDLLGFAYDGSHTNAVLFQVYQEGSSQITGYFDLPATRQEIVRFTASRIGSTIKCYLNNKVVHTQTVSGALDLFSAGTEKLTIGGSYNNDSGLYHNGYVGQLLALNGKGMTDAEVEDWHYSNIPPSTCRPYCVAWYRMNNVYDSKLIDSIEELNYAKQYALVDTNILSGDWTYFANGASVTLTYGSDGDGNYVQFVPDPGGLPSYTYKNASSASRIATYFKWRIKIKRMAGTGQFQFFTNDSTPTSINVSAAETPIGVATDIIIHGLSSAGGTNQSSILSGSSSGAQVGVDYYRIYELEISSVLDGKHGTLFNYTNTELGIPDPSTKTVDADFYDLANPVDRSGNPADRKALKFNGSNQSITVSNFNPTGELGYTVIVGVRKNDNVATAYTGIISKRQSGRYRVLVYATSTTEVQLYTEKSGTGTGFANTAVTKLDQLNYIASVDKNLTTSGALVLQTNGYKTNNPGSAVQVGYDEITGDLVIGMDNTNYLNGHIFHVSVFKGLMTDSEIFDTQVLNRPPDRLWGDCQLYLNFNEIINDSGTYRIPDLSPANRTSDIQLVNFSADEVNPVHADYRLIELSTLI